MKVVLAIIGSRRVGEPERYDQEIFPGATLYPTFKNIAQFNYVCDRLNKAVKKIKEHERKKNPDFDPRRDIEVFIGDADGADEIARLWAIKNQLSYQVKMAKWRLFGKGAGHIRNPDIIVPANYVIAIWDEISPGTAGGIKIAKKNEKKLMIIKYLRHVPYLKKRRL